MLNQEKKFSRALGFVSQPAANHRKCHLSHLKIIKRRIDNKKHISLGVASHIAIMLFESASVAVF